MNKFFDLLQPTIIRASYDEGLPEQVRGRFFINFNVFNIKYFQENYILTENPLGVPYLLLKEDAWGFELENDNAETDILDIPRIYIDITDEFIKDDGSLFQSFVCQAIMQEPVWFRGIRGFAAGKDYYLNTTLYNYLANTNQINIPNFDVRLPNYLDANANITKYWIDLSNEPYKDYKNAEYFNEKNHLLDNKFSEDELNNFYSNFCALILKHTKITDETRIEGINPIYDLVLKYFANYKSDCASASINLILNSMYGTTTKSGCGCNTTITDTLNTSSCSDLYAQAMTTYLTKMLGDADFYRDWFRIYESEEDYIPNDVLCTELTTFINEFISLQNTLSFLKPDVRKIGACPVVSTNENDCNYNKLLNYLKVLGYCANDEIDANVNKIKIYGEQFGELLPMLQF